MDQMGEPTASTSSESEKWTNAASLREVAVALKLACVKKKDVFPVRRNLAPPERSIGVYYSVSD